MNSSNLPGLIRVRFSAFHLWSLVFWLWFILRNLNFRKRKSKHKKKEAVSKGQSFFVLCLKNLIFWSFLFLIFWKTKLKKSKNSLFQAAFAIFLRLWAMARMPISTSTLVFPRSIKRLKFLLCLSSAKTGSTSWHRCFRSLMPFLVLSSLKTLSLIFASFGLFWEVVICPDFWSFLK